MLGQTHSRKKERVYSDPDIVLSKAPSQVWETDVEAREEGTLGEGSSMRGGPNVWQL